MIRNFDFFLLHNIQISLIAFTGIQTIKGSCHKADIPESMKIRKMPYHASDGFTFVHDDTVKFLTDCTQVNDRTFSILLQIFVYLILHSRHIKSVLTYDNTIKLCKIR